MSSDAAEPIESEEALLKTWVSGKKVRRFRVVSPGHWEITAERDNEPRYVPVLYIEPLPDCVHTLSITCPEHSKAIIQTDLVSVQVKLESSQCVVADRTAIERLSVTGSGSLSIGDLATCQDLIVADAPEVSLVVGKRSTVVRCTGTPASLSVDSQSIVQGDRDLGLHAAHLRRGGNNPARGRDYDLTYVDVFTSGESAIVVAEDSRSFRPWFPLRRRTRSIDRREALRLAEKMGADGQDPVAAARLRAFVWSRMASILKEKGVAGGEYAATRELAYQTRRIAAPKWSAEWILLWIGRAPGFGTRIGRPLAIWFAVAATCTLILHFWLAPDAGEPIGGLLLDILTSPAAFLRPSGWDDSITQVIQEAGAPGRALMAVARAIGTTCVVFSALALAMYSRIGGIGRSEG